MSIAVIITDRNADKLCRMLQASLPNVEIQQWPNIHHPSSVELAVLWQHPQGSLTEMSQLKMVVSMGAGMDHIDADPTLPAGIKTARIVTLALQQNMAQYVLQHILSDHRHQAAYQSQQQHKKWQVLETSDQPPTVGFLGLGALGVFVADRCADLGYPTIAWTASQKHPQHPCFHGSEGLQHVCEVSQYLVVLLPLSQATTGIINQQTLKWCGSTAVVINVGRGGHVNDIDLLQALDQGLIRAAVLDVFNTEPLPADHPFWLHPKITLTPHSSSRSDEMQTAAQVVTYYQQLNSMT